MPQDPIFTAFTSQLPPCNLHFLPYTHYSNNLLQCAACLQKIDSPITNLQTIFEHPIALMLDNTPIANFPPPIIKLFLQKYSPYLKDRQQTKQTLIKILNNIKQTISNLCDQILLRYQSHSQRDDNLFEQVLKMTSNYKEQFYRMLEQKDMKVNKSEVQRLFRDYKERNEDPSDKISENIRNVVEEVRRRPWVDWAQVRTLCADVTDGMRWSTLLYHPEFNEAPRRMGKVIVSNLRTPLHNKPYSIEYDEEEVRLYVGPQIADLQKWQFDSMYQIGKYRIVAVNYTHITLIDYLDGKINILNKWSFQGCRELQIVAQNIVVIGVKGTYRIDLANITNQYRTGVLQYPILSQLSY